MGQGPMRDMIRQKAGPKCEDVGKDIMVSPGH